MFIIKLLVNADILLNFTSKQYPKFSISINFVMNDAISLMFIGNLYNDLNPFRDCERKLTL